MNEIELNASKRYIRLGTIKILFLVIIGLLIILVTEEPVVHLVTIWAAALYIAGIVRFDLIHPYCWFPLSFALYNTAYTILYIMGDDQSAGYSSMNAVYTIVAMGIVCLIVGVQKIDESKEYNKDYVINSKANNVFFLMFAGISMLFAVILQSRGYSGKKAMQAANDVFYTIGVHVIRWMMVLMLIQMCSYMCTDRKRNMMYITISLAAALMMGLFTGERDIIFRAILILIITLFYFKRITKKHYFLLLPIGAAIMISSLYFKYYFLRGTGNTAHIDLHRILYSFLMTDFRATGRNTQYLLNNLWTEGYFGIELFFSELLRGLVPVSSFINPSSWYNYEVFPGGFKGQAFTLIGFGHVIGGLYGVILVFVVLGLYIRVIYHRSRNSIYSLAFYLFSITIITACYRQTLNSIVNMSIKAVLVMVLLTRLLVKKQR